MKWIMMLNSMLSLLSFAFFPENAVKDVTNRYASSWMSKTRKLRIDSDWWEDTLQPYKSKNKVNITGGPFTGFL